MTDTSTMHMDVRPGESVAIGDVTVTVAQRARLVIQAPRTTPIKRIDATKQADTSASTTKS